MAATSFSLKAWNNLHTKPGGKWAFSRAVCLKAPYFSTISPTFDVLRPGHCELSIRKHWLLQNHIGTVHAIVMCNMAELAGGMLTEVSVPPTHRWIPKGMSVEYLKKATTDLRAVADWSLPDTLSDGEEAVVPVRIYDTHGEEVFRAMITMWISAQKG